MLHTRLSYAAALARIYGHYCTDATEEVYEKLMGA